MQFIRTWCDLKLWHIQFNVINADTLKKAQKDPQKYRNLIVRIAGYSAYFVDLTPTCRTTSSPVPATTRCKFWPLAAHKMND